MGFHGDQANLIFDPASGDYGLAFFGHSHTTASYLVKHPDFGWQCYYCDAAPVSAASSALQLTPRDSYRRRVTAAPFNPCRVTAA